MPIKGEGERRKKEWWVCIFEGGCGCNQEFCDLKYTAPWNLDERTFSRGRITNIEDKLSGLWTYNYDSISNNLYYRDRKEKK